MKKFLCLLFVLIQFILTASVCSAKVGDVIGYAAYTDIITTINGQQIPSFNVNGSTYVIAEDLANYGFRVDWDSQNRYLDINRNYSQRNIYSEYRKIPVTKGQIGKKAYNILETDIYLELNGLGCYDSYFDESIVESYNINGQTIIYFDVLSTFGNVQWNPAARELSLTIPGLEDFTYEKTAAKIKAEYLERANTLQAQDDYVSKIAMTQMEMNLGSADCFRDWDVLLNEVYNYLRTVLPADEFEALKKDQIEWINIKEADLEKTNNDWVGASMRPLQVNSLGMRYTQERCEYLISLIPDYVY